MGMSFCFDLFVTSYKILQYKEIFMQSTYILNMLDKLSSTLFLVLSIF